jgi:glucokinase
MILAGDVGGTKTNVALLESNGAGLEILRFESYQSREHASLDEIIDAFLGTGAITLEAAGFGVAGPVIGGRAITTNLPWHIDAGKLADRFGLPTAALLNDVEAHAWAVDRLADADLLTIQPGSSGAGNVAIVAAGTGFGVSALIRSAGITVSLASEGGHADFAARSAIEADLLGYLRSRFGHVSVERVLSGPGLVHLYEFLREAGGAVEPEWLGAELAGGDAPATISRTAVSGRNETCERALDLFLELYGAEAGNWALRTMATGGVYLGGGIAAKLLGASSDASDAWRKRASQLFLKGFLAKGRFRPMLEAMPVQVIVNEQAPLIGAARCALTTRAAKG